MSTHTPGPWEARGVIIYRSTPDADTGATPLLCVVTGDGTSVAEDEANARLVAAAPDLLEAAKACLPSFDLMWPPEDATGRRGQLREALRAAIAKAEGDR